MNGNLITAPPDWLCDLTSLAELSLRRNRLTELPARLGNIDPADAPRTG